MDLFNSEKRNCLDYGRGDSDLFWRGLTDGYRLEQERIQRMRKEKEEGKMIDKKLKNIMKEWEHDFRLKIEKEIPEELTLELNKLREVIEEERKELKSYMEEMKIEKEERLKIEKGSEQKRDNKIQKNE